MTLSPDYKPIRVQVTIDRMNSVESNFVFLYREANSFHVQFSNRNKQRFQYLR
jgi:hypothetical protein